MVRFLEVDGGVIPFLAAKRLKLWGLPYLVGKNKPFKLFISGSRLSEVKFCNLRVFVGLPWVSFVEG